MNQDYFLRIESDEFSAELNIASGKRQFFKLLATEPIILEILNYSRENSNAPMTILRRLERLIRLDSDIRFENPNDVAITTYLWILNELEPISNHSTYINIGLELASQARQVWWSKILLEELLFENLKTENVYATTESTVTTNDLPVVIFYSQASNNLPIISHLVRDILNYVVSRNYKFDANASSANESTSEILYQENMFSNFRHTTLKLVSSITIENPSPVIAYEWR